MTDVVVAITDTLLPGDATLPPASGSGIVLAEWGGPPMPGSSQGRAAAVRAVEVSRPREFNVALLALLARYYASAEVLHALDWRASPPQPEGHVVPEAGPDTWASLDRVRARGRLWR